MSFKYSDEVLRRFYNPANAGQIENPDGVGVVGNPACGDVMKLYIKVENDIIIDVKFETLGCAAAISVSDLLCDLVKGKTLADAFKITKKDLVARLGGLPSPKFHCSLLGIDALHKAVEDFKSKK